MYSDIHTARVYPNPPPFVARVGRVTDLVRNMCLYCSLSFMCSGIVVYGVQCHLGLWVEHVLSTPCGGRCVRQGYSTKRKRPTPRGTALSDGRQQCRKISV